MTDPMARIRRASAKDVDAISNLFRLAYSLEAKRDKDPGVLVRVASPKRVRQFITENETYVLEEGERIVATGTVQPTAYIRRVATLPSEQGRGHGQAIVDYLLERTQSGPYSRVSLDADEKLPWLIKWYEKLGFQVNARMEFSGTAFTAVHMDLMKPKRQAKGRKRTPAKRATKPRN